MLKEKQTVGFKSHTTARFTPFVCWLMAYSILWSVDDSSPVTTIRTHIHTSPQVLHYYSRRLSEYIALGKDTFQNTRFVPWIPNTIRIRTTTQLKDRDSDSFPSHNMDARSRSCDPRYNSCKCGLTNRLLLPINTELNTYHNLKFVKWLLYVR